MSSLFIYATLEAIKEKKGNVTSLIEVYQELVESAIKLHFSSIAIRGQISELKNTIQEEYNLPIPTTTLEFIVDRIANENKKNFKVYHDHSFDFSDIEFSDVSEIIDEQKQKVQILESVYNHVKEELNIQNACSIEDLIEKNKNNLLSYFAGSSFVFDVSDSDINLLTALLRVPEQREIIERLFLGAVISSFTSLDIEGVDDAKTILIDTNFIISLLDLHSKESKENCDLILNIGKKLKYDFCILPETIIEIQNLLLRKSREILEVPVFAAQDMNSIEYGCFRHGIASGELLCYREKVVTFVKNCEIRIIDKSINDRLQQKAISTDIYLSLSRRKRNKDGALHDAMAMLFVKELRTGEETNFSDSTSFFLTDSHGYFENKLTINTKLPLVIRVEELVNLLWLLNPYNDTKLVKTEISKIFSMYLKKKLPNKELLIAIDRKNRNYKKLGITKKDCTEMAFQINEASNEELGNILSINEEQRYFEEMGKLATELIKRKERREDIIIEYTEAIIDQTWTEKNKDLLSENQGLRDKAVTAQNVVQESIIHTKNVLFGQQKTLNELIQNIEERINELQKPIDTLTITLQLVFISIGLFIITYSGIKVIVPNWSKIEPFTFIFELTLPLIIIILELVGFKKETKLFSFSHFISSIIYKKNITKSLQLKNDLVTKYKEREVLINRIDEIIY